jgi:hypothetical protein
MRMEEFYTHATRTIGASHENGWRTHRVDRVLGERLDIEGSRWNLGESDQARRRAIRRSSSGRRVNGIGWFRKYLRLWGLSHRDAWRQVETRTFVAATMAWLRRSRELAHGCFPKLTQAARRVPGLKD